MRLSLVFLVVCVSCCLFGVISSNDVSAQAIRYMDESGNLHFVDSIYQVPLKYRNQVLAPTPAPTGRVKPTRRPTSTPRPTRTPKPKLTKAPKGTPNSVFSNFPHVEPGQLPPVTSVPQEKPQAAPEKPGRLRPPPLPLLGGPPPGVPSGVLAPGVAPSVAAPE